MAAISRQDGGRASGIKAGSTSNTFTIGYNNDQRLHSVEPVNRLARSSCGPVGLFPSQGGGRPVRTDRHRQRCASTAGVVCYVCIRLIPYKRDGRFVCDHVTRCCRC
ncbi:Protein of unknown function [Pyronema omphalodes CBS 100304]|uniref:Uncharacterized protein n=1 Tax=Pyronema omphalodes (strain CBS 100304) TaxID=1076935 RepID=U4LBI8_PYROM|nr:Protein of unknown function [Pyronema omphalodes CBS 100304]